MSKKALSATEQKEKVQYRVKNWSEHDAALVKRGNVTVWFAEDEVRTSGDRETRRRDTVFG